MKRSWFPPMIFLLIPFILFSLPALGCQNARRAKVLAGCDDAIFFDGYVSGFNSGAAEGYGDCSKGEAYSPSLQDVDYGSYRRSSGYRQGYSDGYDYGWSTPKDGAAEKGKDWYELAVARSSQGGGKDVTGYTVNVADHNDGYSSGYKVGKKKALDDSKKGEDYYNDTPPDSEIDHYCRSESEDFRKAWLAGYKEGYRKNRSTADKGDTPNGDYEIVPEYQSGYEEGYKKGLWMGEQDKKAGYYDDAINVYDLIGSEEYQRGFKDGYKKGYEKGHAGS